MDKRQSLDKLTETLTSVKFWILFMSTLFFYLGKLTESTWQEILLVTAGLRTVNEVTSIASTAVTKYSETKIGRGKVDDPDA